MSSPGLSETAHAAAPAAASDAAPSVAPDAALGARPQSARGAGLEAAALPSVLAHAIALGAGALLACAFAPLSLWPLAILCPAVQMWLWEGATPRRAASTGLAFGAGTFGLGTWWLFISIHGVGGAPVWLAVALVVALVGAMALYQALLGWLCARLLPARGALRWLLGLPGLWLLVEWWRGWFLSGFPWLSLGYSQTDTPLASLAPIGGVYGISALLLVGSGALVALVRGSSRVRVAALALLAAPWVLGVLAGRLSWTHPAGGPLSVAVLQGGVPENLKWQAENLAPTQALYTRLEQKALGARLIVWPEAAIPDLANDMPKYLGDIYSAARRHGSDVLMGVVRVEEPSGHYYDSIITMADQVSFYDKHHLVPFAEYFPVPQFVRSWLRLMSLPYSDFTPGAAVQPAIVAGGARLAPSICYEDAYGSAALPALRQGATLLVNVSNDAWFGHSWARYQHFQIARMRAQEAERPLIRAANDGVSALVGPRGRVLAEAPEFQASVLTGQVQPASGTTPYMRFGNWLAVVLGLLATIAAIGLGLVTSARTRRP